MSFGANGARLVRVRRVLGLSVLLYARCVCCDAVLFASTSNTTHNTTAPTGALTNSGWQYQGVWGNFLATPIAPTYFIAAKHVGGATGDVFVLNGFTYTTLSFTDCPNADLRVWKVGATFPQYAPLYTNSDEVGKHIVVFGRGTQRGEPVNLNSQLKGWLWGASDGVQRWGENDVASIYNGGAGIGNLLRATFDRSATTTNECHLSVGDSSGASFIQDSGGTWRLAGIHYSVDGYFSTNGVNGSGFNAALLDMGGFYIGTDGNWTFITNQVGDIPSAFYSTRISTNLSWINSVIDFAPGTDMTIKALGPIGANVQITFNTSLSRLYRVQRCDDLVAGIWTTFTNNIPGTGNPVSVIDPNAATLPKRFYRVGFAP